MCISRPFRIILLTSCLYISAHIIGGCIPAAFPATAAEAETPGENQANNSLSNSNVPTDLSEIMRYSRAKYLEGSDLIKAGDSERAREAFDDAVDLILKSDWDLASTPVLNRFFQEMIQRIQDDESFYLTLPANDESSLENVVVEDLHNVDLKPVADSSSLKGALTSDLANAEYGIPIEINEMVLKSLDFWMNRNRKLFVDGLLRSGQYRPIIERIFREESIPLDLMYLAQVESLFRTHAVSKAQAKGIWQFQKETAIIYGLKVNKDIDERSDPEKSTRAAARYLSDLFAVFKDWNLVLAAYNWGSGRVQRLMDSTGLKDFWQLVDLKKRLPEETKNHVPRIQASVIIARNPEKYDLPLKLDPPLRYAEVSVSKPIDLHAAAKLLGTSIDELKKLNPALRGFTTPANYPNFHLKVPINSDPKVQEQVAALPAVTIKPVPNSIRHQVRSGETLSEIAARYKISVLELEKANGLSSGKKLKTGTLLRIPSKPSIPNAAIDSKIVPASAKPSPSKNLKSTREKDKRASSTKSGTVSNGKSSKKAESQQIASR
jgi:membrane-bound lytic murein transglycosylase D